MFLGSLEEARAKSNMAQMYSDLSANDEHMSKNVPKKIFERKQLESPPTLKSSKMYYLPILDFVCLSRG